MSKHTNSIKRAERIALRKRMYLEDQHCYWCGEVMVLHVEPDEIEEMATIEHLQPRCDGGDDSPDNLRLAHRKCNR